LILGLSKLLWPNPALLERLAVLLDCDSAVGTLVYATISIIEVLIGAGLLLGPHPAMEWASLVVAMLLAAAGVATSGIDDCGCFGRVAAPPWLRVGAAGALASGSYMLLRLHLRRDERVAALQGRSPDARRPKAPEL
jgi:hypothetical protein